MQVIGNSKHYSDTIGGLGYIQNQSIQQAQSLGKRSQSDANLEKLNNSTVLSNSHSVEDKCSKPKDKKKTIFKFFHKKNKSWIFYTIFFYIQVVLKQASIVVWTVQVSILSQACLGVRVSILSEAWLAVQVSILSEAWLAVQVLKLSEACLAIDTLRSLSRLIMPDTCFYNSNWNVHFLQVFLKFEFWRNFFVFFVYFSFILTNSVVIKKKSTLYSII